MASVVDSPAPATWMADNRSFDYPPADAADATITTAGKPPRFAVTLRERWDRAVRTFASAASSSPSGSSAVAPSGSTAVRAAAAASARWFDRIAAMHSSSSTGDEGSTTGRAYHTLVHLEEMFGYLDLLPPPAVPAASDSASAREASVGDGAMVEATEAVVRAVAAMATFFHDAVYDPKSGTNEEDSAELFEEFAADLKVELVRVEVHENKSDEDKDGQSDERSGEEEEEEYDELVRWVVRYILATKSHSASEDHVDDDDDDDDDAAAAQEPDSSARTDDDDDLERRRKQQQRRRRRRYRRRLLSAHLHTFLDADMSVLAKEPHAYDAYAGLIRVEYGFVPRDVYCAKRAEVLRSFLASENGVAGDGNDTGAATITRTAAVEEKFIFATEAMRGWYEQKARDNVRREIGLLERGIIPCERVENLVDKKGSKKS